MTEPSETQQDKKNDEKKLGWWDMPMSPLAGLFFTPIIFGADGTCFSFLWNWFVHPIGLPTIGPAHAFGLLMSYMTFQGGMMVFQATTPRVVVSRLLSRTAMLFVGSVTHHLM